MPPPGPHAVPDPPLAAWSPPAYEVDANGKVVGAAPGSPNNWGRWGDDDQLGTANLLTSERLAAAAALVRRGDRFALGVPIGHGTGPGSGFRPPPLHLMQVAAGDGVLTGMPIQGSDDYVVMALQTATQIDSLAHLTAGHVLYNGFWAGLVTAMTGARRLGIHNVHAGIAGRGVLLDVARHRGVERLGPGDAITADELDACASAQGVEVRAGDVLMVRTGFLGGWWSLDRAAQARYGLGGEPGLSPSTIPWLHDHDVALLACDNVAVEVSPAVEGTSWMDLHVAALPDLGMYLGELFDLDALADDCAADGVYEGLFVANVLPVAYAVGSPLNPVLVK